MHILGLQIVFLFLSQTLLWVSMSTQKNVKWMGKKMITILLSKTIMVSDFCLHCLLMSHEKDVRLIWVKTL